MNDLPWYTADVDRRLIAIVVLALGIAGIFIFRLAEDGGGGGHNDVDRAVSEGVATLPRAGGNDMPAWRIRAGFPNTEVAGVVMASGMPVAGAQVVAGGPHVASGLAEPVTTVTDSSGTFTFGELPALEWWVTAQHPDGGAATVIVDLAAVKSALRPGRLVIDVPGCEHLVRGVVRDSSGGVVAGAQVMPVGDPASILPDGFWRAPPVLSGTDGGYRLCAHPGELSLQFGAEGFGAVVHRVSALFGEFELDAFLMPEGRVSGRVIDEQGQAIVSTAEVTLVYSGGGASAPARTSTTTGADGTFEVGGLAVGTYRVSVTGPGYGSTEDVEVFVEPTQTAEVTIPVESLATIRGRVLSAGQAVQGVAVTVIRETPRSRTQKVRTNAQGAFVVADAPIGEVSFGVEGHSVESPKALTVDGSGASDVELQVEPWTAMIEGRVMSGDTPVVGAVVWAKDRTDGSRRSLGRSGTDGVFRGWVRAEPRSLYAESETKGAFSPKVDIEPSVGQHITDIRIDLSHGGQVEGRVLDQDGRPVADLAVTLNLEDTDYGYAITNAAGRFRATMMTGGGDYVVEIKQSTSTPPLEIVGRQGPLLASLADGRSSTDLGDVVVRYQRLAIAGTVTDDVGETIADAWVRVVPVRAQHSVADSLRYGWGERSAISDADGNFSVSPVASGPHAVYVRGSRGSEALVHPVEGGTNGLRIIVDSAGQITGTVTGFDARPRIAIERVDGESMVRTYANVQGEHFVARGLRPGDYLVTASLGESSAGARVTVEAGGSATVALASEHSHFVSIVVDDPRTADTNRIQLATCRAQRTGRSAEQFAATRYVQTGQTRRVVFELPAGDYVIVCHESGWTGSAAISVPKEGTSPSVKLAAPREP